MASKTNDNQTKPNGIIELPYREERIVVNADSADRFRRMQHRRDPSPSHTSTFVRMMRDGRTFAAPIIVNEKTVNGKKVWIVIDGNHRLDAALQMIEQYPGWPGLRALFIIYSELTPQQEAQVYDDWNSGKRETFVDFLQVHQTEYPIFRALVAQSIAPNVRVVLRSSPVLGDVRFFNVLAGYLCRYQIETVLSKRDQTALSEIKRLNPTKTKADWNDFFVPFVNVFGAPGKGNYFSKGTPISALWKTYGMNIEKLGAQEIERRWRRVAIDPTVRHLMRGTGDVSVGTSGGSNAMYVLAQAMATAMDYHKSKNVTTLPTVRRKFPSQYEMEARHPKIVDE